MVGNSTRKTIAEIRKRENAVIRISDCDLAGIRYCEIRQYYKGSDGVYVPSNKGVTFTPEHIGEIISGLEKLKNGIDNT